MTILGTDTFPVPRFFTEGAGINLEQNGVVQALTISVDQDILDDILGSSVITTDYQESVRLILIADTTLVGTQTLQSVTLEAGDRVLATAQNTAANNRIWIVQDADWTIAEGFDVTDTITSGTVVPCEEGSQAGRIAVLTTPDPITLGTTPLAWEIGETSDVFISNFIGRNGNAATFTFNTSTAKSWIFADRTGNQTFTIPTNSTAALSIGTEVIIQHNSASGTKTIQAVSASVTLNGTAGGSVTLTNRGDAYFLKKKSANVWTAAPMKAGLAAIADGDYGDIVVSGTGTVMSIDAGVIVNADINASAAIDATKIADGSVTSTEFQYINTLSSNAQTQLNAKASTSQTDFISGIIATAANQDYRLVVKIPHACTITETVTRCASGTCTATFKINTTALGGTANSVSSSEQAQSHASSNSVAADDDIVVTISANASCLDMSFTIKFTRTLA